MTDVVYMEEALAEARRGWGATHPNPMVGCVIVENGQVVSRGYHARAGGPHAEINALKNLGRRPKAAATLYVTLEPCSSKGKTGPCTQAILESGIGKVVIGAVDPDQRHQGRGIEILRSAGVDITVGILAEAAEDLNLIFNHVAKTGQPLLAGKSATTLDGKVATRSGQSQWITGEEARANVMLWRRLFPAIAVGSGTVAADNPHLTSRIGGTVVCPVRFLFDRHLRSVAGLNRYQLFTDEFKHRTVIVTVEGQAGVRAIEDAGIQWWELPSQAEAFWRSFKERCIQDSLTAVYFEGGPGLLSDLLANRQLDYLFSYRAPKFLADDEAPAFVRGQSVGSMASAFSLSQVHQASLGFDQLTRGFVNYSG